MVLHLVLIGYLFSITALNILGHYLTYTDPYNEETRISSVAAIAYIADVGHERVPSHAREVFEPLIRLLYEVSQLDQGQESNQNLYQASSDCLCLCASLAPREFSNLCFDLDKVKVNPPFDLAVEKAFQSVAEVTEKEN